MHKLILAAVLSLGCSLVQAAASLAPVENPALVRAVREFLAVRNPEARQRMFIELNRATYLLALQRQPDGTEQYASFELPGVGRCMPAFTSHQEVVIAGLQGQQLADVAAVDLWDRFERDQLDCVLIDPGSRPLPLRRPLIEQIRRS